MKILNQATKAAHKATLIQKTNHQRYSCFPVHEAEFWLAIFDFAKKSKTAQKVLDEISKIEDEPCIENDRVFRSVQTAKALARLTLLH